MANVCIILHIQHNQKRTFLSWNIPIEPSTREKRERERERESFLLLLHGLVITNPPRCSSKVWSHARYLIEISTVFALVYISRHFFGCCRCRCY
jgi:hypothetical protein